MTEEKIDLIAYVGPMLDSIEDDYTRMAREIKEATA